MRIIRDDGLSALATGPNKAEPPVRKRAARPRDAATLVLVRRIDDELTVLMGQRNAKHRFMPDTYVFPGGRVDRADGYVTPATPLRTASAVNLQKTASAHRAQAIAMAAIRETFEETGLLLSDGKPRPTPSNDPGWQRFFAAGGAPRLDQLDYFCRAVTPPFRPMRFNARFFFADGEAARGTLGGSGELLYLDWLPVQKALELELPGITKVVLQNLHALAAMSREVREARGVTFFRMAYGRRVFSTE